MTKPMVMLNDGTQVPLEIFITWHPTKQNRKTRPIEEVNATIEKVAVKNRRAVNTPLGQFRSVKDARNAVKMSTAVFRCYLLNTAYPEYSYVNPEPNDIENQFHKIYKIFSKTTVTPLGTFKSKAKAAEAHGLSTGEFGRLMTHHSDEYYYLSDGPNNRKTTKKLRKERVKTIANGRMAHCRAVITPIGQFPSIADAAILLGIPYCRLRKYLLSAEYPDYSFVNPNSKDLARQIRAPTPDDLDATRIRRGMAHRRAVITPKGQFASVNEAAKALGISKGVLRYFCLNTAYPKYSYVNPTIQEIAKQFHKVHKVGPKKTVTPIGTFKSKIAAANALGILKDQLGKLMTTNPNEYYYAEDSVNRSHEFLNVSGIDPVKGYRLPKVIMTPSGPFPSKLQAALAYFMPSKQFDVLLELEPDKFYFIKRKK